MYVTTPHQKIGQNSRTLQHGIPRTSQAVHVGQRAVVKWPAWKIIFSTIGLGLLGVFYLNHVFYTQKLLREVNVLKLEHQKIRRIHADRTLTFQRMTGPAEVYKRARSMGLQNGGTDDPKIFLAK